MDRLAILRLRLPVGYTFAPSDEEFVGFYLRRKALARRPGQDVVPEFDVFKTVPKKLPSGGRIFLGNKFFFMDLKNSAFESDDKRKAGSGYWKAAGPVKDVGRNGKLIGKRKRLVFWRRRGKGDTFVRTRWIMHEFRLFVTAGHPTHKISSWAGYKIFLRKARKNRKNKRAERAEARDSRVGAGEEDEESMQVDDDDDVEQPSVMNFAAESGTDTGPPSPTTSDSFTSQ